MAPVLLVAAVPGVLVLLEVGWQSFVGDSLYGGASAGASTHTRFVDRAASWVAQGAGGQASWASLAALTAFTVVTVSRANHHQGVPRRMRLAALGLTVILGLLELSGPLTIAVGYVQLARDPTAARSPWTEFVYNGPPTVLSLVLATLTGLLAWVLRRDHRHDQSPTGTERIDGAASTRDSAVGAAATNGTDDPEALFRRPMSGPGPG